MMKLTNFEHAILEKLLIGDHWILKALRRQLDACNVRQREMTGSGFYTYFDVPAELQISGLDLRFGDVIAEIPGLESGAGFLLYAKNGKLDMLEGYSYDEQWPSEVLTFNLKYTSGEKRDWVALEKILEIKK